MTEPCWVSPHRVTVDVLGEPIDPTRFDNVIVICCSEEVWGIGAPRVA
jgi:hypothetical protein